jgi:hypothetical protein
MKRINIQTFIFCSIIILLTLLGACNTINLPEPKLKAAAAAVIIEGAASLPLGGSLIKPYQTSGSDVPLRAQVLVITNGKTKICMGSCDISLFNRDFLDEIGREVEAKYGIPFNNIMLGATNNHSAPVQKIWSDTAADQTFNIAIKNAIMEAIGLANEKLNNGDEMDCYFALGDVTIGQNSRLIMEDSSILWAPTIYKFGYNRPTGPYDPQLPVLVFKNRIGKPETILFNHSTQNIDSPVDRVISPSFYGKAAQKIEKESGGTSIFFIGAYGSSNVFDDCPNSERECRVEQGIKKAYAKAKKIDINRLVSVKKEFEFKYRTFNEDEQQKAVSDYCNRWLKESIFWHAEPEQIIQGFKKKRDLIAPLQGKSQKTWLQVILLGDIAFVGVPGGLFGELGMEIKRRSPFRYTYIVGLANDFIGYIPDNESFKLGGYQTWAHVTFSERGTGEVIIDEALRILNDLYREK